MIGPTAINCDFNQAFRIGVPERLARRDIRKRSHLRQAVSRHLKNGARPKLGCSRARNRITKPVYIDDLWQIIRPGGELGIGGASAPARPGGQQPDRRQQARKDHGRETSLTARKAATGFLATARLWPGGARFPSSRYPGRHRPCHPHSGSPACAVLQRPDRPHREKQYRPESYAHRPQAGKRTGMDHHEARQRRDQLPERQVPVVPKPTSSGRNKVRPFRSR